jgi:hypothetical protein
MKFFRMVQLFKRYMLESKAAIAVEFAIILIFYFPLFLILIDLMMVIGQWADVQRANGQMAEFIKNRIPPIVAAGYDGTATDGMVFVNTYCSFLVFSGLCNNMTLYVYTPITTHNFAGYIPTTRDAVFCYQKNMSCFGAFASNPLNNTNNVVLFTTTVVPYRITIFPYITNSIFGQNISATNIVSLND